MSKGVVDILVKLSDTKLEIGSSVSNNSYSMKVRICLLLACSASVKHNSLLGSSPSLPGVSKSTHVPTHAPTCTRTHRRKACLLIGEQDSTKDMFQMCISYEKINSLYVYQQRVKHYYLYR